MKNISPWFWKFLGNPDRRAWKKLFIFTILGSLLAGVLLFVAFFWYHKTIYNQILEKDMEQINESSDFVAKSIYTELMHGIHVLENMNQSLNLNGTMDAETAQKFVTQAGTDEAFSEIGILYFQGDEPEGVECVIADEAFEEKIKNQEYYMSNVQADGKADEGSIFMAVPLFHESELVGAIWAKYPVAELTEKVNLDDTTYRYFHIIDTQGRYITYSANQYVLSQEDNLWDEVERYDLQDTTIEEIRTNLETCKSDNFWFDLDGKARYVSYQPLGMNHWYIFSVLAEEALSGYVKSIEWASLVLMICVGVFVAVIMIIISRAAYYTALNMKRKNRELEIKSEIFTAVQRKTNVIIFTYNMKKNELTIYHNDEENQEEQIEAELFSPSRMLELNLIKKESYDVYQKLYDAICKGQRYQPVEMQMRLGNEWRWRRIFSWKSRAGDMIGFIEDIDNWQEKIKDINQKAKLDPLTGLYNRKWFEEEAGFFLENGNGAMQALFYLDLDHFKAVNDCLGHAMGDQALREAAEILHCAVPEDNLACRIGGDEFVLFLPDVKDMETVHQIAEKLVTDLERTYEKDGVKVKVSASIGIAIAKERMSLQELSETADKALYAVKQAQRNGYKIAEI